MFQEKNFKCVGFDSTWKNEIESRNETSQTTEFSVQDQETHTKRISSVQIQTEAMKESNSVDETDMNKLAQWLKSIYPTVQKELDDVSLTNAMKSVTLPDDASCTSSNMLQQINVSAKSDKEDQFVSGLSWNSTGNTIAISCSHTHNSWCSHEGLIQLFTFDRNNKLSPNNKLVCGSCVTSLNFHPTEPSILCAGTISGEIFLWDCQNDAADGLVSSFTCHNDKVTSIRWVSNTDLKKESVVLVTVSLDSCLILWEVNILDSAVKIKQKYKIDKGTQLSKIDDIYSKRTEKGILDVDFSQHITGLFILGMEGGLILKCSLLGAKPLSSDVSSLPVLDPFISSFEKHQGEITSISFSPHRKDLFLTSATDDEIRIYHTEQANPLQTIFMETTLNSVDWIPYEDKLLVGCGEDGSIKIYSLLNGQHIPNISAIDSSSLTTLAVNRKRVNNVAFGNINGHIQLWFIPWNSIAKQDCYNVFKK